MTFSRCDYSLTLLPLVVTLNVCSTCHVVKDCTKFEWNEESAAAELLTIWSIFAVVNYVTLSWPLTPLTWTFAVHRVSLCDQTLYHFLNKRLFSAQWWHVQFLQFYRKREIRFEHGFVNHMFNQSEIFLLLLYCYCYSDHSLFLLTYKNKILDHLLLHHIAYRLTV